MHLENKCRWKELQGQGQCVESSLPTFHAPLGLLDTDTPLGVHSYHAAKHACSAAFYTIDQLMQAYFHKQEHAYATKNHENTEKAYQQQQSPHNHCNRAFLISRPPGHHAGPHGCVPSNTFWKRPDMTSSGFCLLNTVAIAAAYMRYTYGSLALRNQSLLHSTSSSSSSSAVWKYTKVPKIAIVDIDIHHGNGTEEIVRSLT